MNQINKGKQEKNLFFDENLFAINLGLLRKVYGGWTSLLNMEHCDDQKATWNIRLKLIVYSHFVHKMPLKYL